MSKINFPKKQEQRLIPKYLLEYSEELVKNHPDPTAEWGGGGSTYTAGEGIVIDNNEISVDAEDVALIKNLANIAFSGSYNDLSGKPDLSVYELKSEAFTGDYNDLTNKPTIPTVNDSTITFTQGGVTKGTITLNQSSNQTIALDAGGSVPTNMVTTNTQQNITAKKTFTNNNKLSFTDTNTVGSSVQIDNLKIGTYHKTNGTADGQSVILDGNNNLLEIKDTTQNVHITQNTIVYTDTNTAANSKTYNLAGNNASRIATLDDIPNVGSGVLTIKKNGTTVDTFSANATANKTVNITVPTKTSDITNDSGFITGVTWNDVTNKPTFATVATTGAYNDLTNKPTIPTVNDATISLYQGNILKGSFTVNQGNNTSIYLDAGSSDAPVLRDNSITGLVTEATYGSNAKPSISILDVTGTPVTYKLNLPEKNGTFATLDDIPTVPTKTSDLTNDSGFITSSALSGLATETYVDNAVDGLDQTLATVAKTGSYSDLSNKPDLSIYELKSEAFSGNYGDLTNKPDLSIYAQSANLAAVATSGSYNDLTNKPTIPTVNDNTITITQGGVTKGSFTLNQSSNQTIDVDDVPGMIGEVIYDQPNGVQNATSLTMAHSFADYSYVDIQYRIFDSADYVQSARIYDPNGKMVSLDWKMNTDWTSSNVYGKCSRYTLSGTTLSVVNETGYEFYNNTMAGLSHENYQYQILITKVVGYKQNSAPIVIPTVPTQKYRHQITVGRYDATATFEVTFTIVDANSSDLTIGQVALFLANYDASILYPIDNAWCYYGGTVNDYRPIQGIYKYQNSDTVRAVIITGRGSNNQPTTNALNATAHIVGQVTTAL